MFLNIFINNIQYTEIFLSQHTQLLILYKTDNKFFGCFKCFYY
jgi:hypothetical protein